MKVSSVSKKKLEINLAKLKGPEWDSSSDEGEDDDSVVTDGIKTDSGSQKNEENKKLISDVTDLKKIKKKGSKSKKFAQKKDRETISSVFYLGHIPKYFEDDELMGFLKQFGHVVRMKIARSLKTGNCKGYAFVQMSTPKIANIVVDTLSGYMLFQKKLVCHMVPASQIHNGMFHSKKSTLVSKKQILDRRLKNKEHLFHGPKSISKMKKITLRLLEREKKKREAMKSIGIDFDFPGYDASEQKMKKVNIESISSDVIDKTIVAGDNNIKDNLSNAMNKISKEKTVIQEDKSNDLIDSGEIRKSIEKNKSPQEDATSKHAKSKKKKKSKKRKESLISEISEEPKKSDDNNSQEKTKCITQSKKGKLGRSEELPDNLSLKKDESSAATPDKEEIEGIMKGVQTLTSANTQQAEKKKSKKKKKEKKGAKRREISSP